MCKRILSATILAVYALVAVILPVSATDAGYKTASIVVESFGNQYKEEVLQDNSGTIYAPITWLTRYGLMACAEESSNYVFYHVGEERVRPFAKRIFIDKSGTGAKCGCYVSETRFVTYATPQFSGTYTKNAVLYLPMVELLPLLNAKVEITADGVLHITSNYVSIFSALYAIDLQVLRFDADQDMIGSEFVSAAGLVVDTIFNFRFDRLDGLYNTGEMNDYKSLFKAYLVDDEVYLSAYDKEITPEEAYVEILRNALGDIDSTLGNATKIPKFVEYLLDSSEFPAIHSFVDDISDFSDVLDEGADVVEGVYKLVNYLDAYEKQIEDHRNMLDAVYGGEYFSQANPACQAAAETGRLYSNDTSCRLVTAVEVGLRDFVTDELPSLALTELTSIAPYKIAFSITKLAIPEAFEEFEDAALLSYMDQAVHDACKVYNMRVENLSLERDDLNDLRLTAMMALVASRHAYNTFWDDYSKVEDINSALTLLYLSSDSVECESQEYYAEEKADLTANMYRLNVVVNDSETSVTLPSALVGQWNYCFRAYETDYISELRLQENGEAFVLLGIMHSEPLSCYGGTWGATGENGMYTLTLRLHGGSSAYKKICDFEGSCEYDDHGDYTLVCNVSVDGDLLKIQRISGDSSVSIMYDQWYERD